MNLDRYALTAGDDFTSFKFISTGPNGSIIKVIQFQKTRSANIYNLAFGDKNVRASDFDDLAVSNNGDTEKVLATVIDALYIFFDHYPDVLVAATGSTPTRTRLYRMSITKFHTEMILDFQVVGIIDGTLEEFEVNKDYSAFLVKRKFV
jgi:hypothetical protein